MSRNAFGDGWRRRVDDDIYADASYAADLGAILIRLNDPGAPRTALDDVVTQRTGPIRYDRHDAAALYEAALLLNLGRYVIANVPRPRGDPALPSTSMTFPDPFVAVSAGDGPLRLRWTSDITITHVVLPDHPLAIEYQPSEVALAVGLIDPADMVWHLRHSAGIACWPAGHDVITPMMPTPGHLGAPPAPPAVVHGAHRAAALAANRHQMAAGGWTSWCRYLARSSAVFLAAVSSMLIAGRTSADQTAPGIGSLGVEFTCQVNSVTAPWGVSSTVAVWL